MLPRTMICYLVTLYMFSMDSPSASVAWQATSKALTPPAAEEASENVLEW